MRTIFIILLASVLILSACASQPSLEDQHARGEIIETKEDVALKCKMGDLLYYTKSRFIYYQTNNDYEHILTPVGEYSRKISNQSRGWDLRPYLNKDDNLYIDNLKYFIDRKTPDDKEIMCVETQETPKKFQDFIDTRYRFFENITVSILDDQNASFFS